MGGKRKAAFGGAVALLLLLVGCGGGGGGGGGTDYDLAGDPFLIGYWVRDAGVSPMTQAFLYSEGDYAGLFVDGCEVTGHWYTGENKLKLTVATVSSASLCGYYDIERGTKLVMGYELTTPDAATIVNRDGTTWYIRAP